MKKIIILVLTYTALAATTAHSQSLRSRVQDIEDELIKARLQSRVIALEQELIIARKEINAYRETTAGLLARMTQLEDLMRKYQPQTNEEPNIRPTEKDDDNIGSQVARHPTMIEFEEMVFDFGSIPDNATTEHTFVFRNTGKNPLTIERAFGSCGCTTPVWPKEPIAAGATGKIVVSFDPKDKKGSQQKIVTIVANTIPSQTQIYVKAFIK
jgi:hypothetical protein